MIVRILISLLAFFFALDSFAQEKIDWKLLADVRFEDKYYEEVDAYLYYPTFGESVTSMEGKEVYIQGFIFPFEGPNPFFILSQNPYSSCFFCGAAGPESVVELWPVDDFPRFNMDDIVTIKGTLKLNSDDIDYCNYILENAQVHRP